MNADWYPPVDRTDGYAFRLPRERMYGPGITTLRICASAAIFLHRDGDRSVDGNGMCQAGRMTFASRPKAGREDS